MGDLGFCWKGGSTFQNLARGRRCMRAKNDKKGGSAEPKEHPWIRHWKCWYYHWKTDSLLSFSWWRLLSHWCCSGGASYRRRVHKREKNSYYTSRGRTKHSQGYRSLFVNVDCGLFELRGSTGPFYRSNFFKDFCLKDFNSAAWFPYIVSVQ